MWMDEPMGNCYRDRRGSCDYVVALLPPNAGIQAALYFCDLITHLSCIACFQMTPQTPTPSPLYFRFCFGFLATHHHVFTAEFSAHDCRAGPLTTTRSGARVRPSTSTSKTLPKRTSTTTTTTSRLKEKIRRRKSWGKSTRPLIPAVLAVAVVLRLRKQEHHSPQWRQWQKQQQQRQHQRWRQGCRTELDTFFFLSARHFFRHCSAHGHLRLYVLGTVIYYLGRTIKRTLRCLVLAFSIMIVRTVRQTFFGGVFFRG